MKRQVLWMQRRDNFFWRVYKNYDDEQRGAEPDRTTKTSHVASVIEQIENSRVSEVSFRVRVIRGDTTLWKVVHFFAYHSKQVVSCGFYLGGNAILFRFVPVWTP